MASTTLPLNGTLLPTIEVDGKGSRRTSEEDLTVRDTGSDADGVKSLKEYTVSLVMT
jgi:hypothetical protein